MNKPTASKLLVFRLFLTALVLFGTLGCQNPQSVLAPNETLSREATPAAWVPGLLYSKGDFVTYKTTVFRCAQSHRSTTGWEPDNAPALWTPLPPVPTGLSVTVIVSNAIVRWTPVRYSTGFSYDTSYELRTGGLVFPATSPYSGPRQSYSVRAVNFAGTSPWSAWVAPIFIH